MFRILCSSSIVVLVLLQLNSHLTDGAVAMGKAEKHPDHPNSCYIPDTGNLYSIGSEWSMGKDVCGRIRCVGDQNSELYLSYESCGSVHVEPPCVLESDLSLPYPECCPRPKCDESSVDILDDSNSNDISRQKVGGGGTERDNETIVQYDVTLDDDVSAVDFQEETRNRFPFEVNMSIGSNLPR